MYSYGSRHVIWRLELSNEVTKAKLISQITQNSTSPSYKHVPSMGEGAPRPSPIHDHFPHHWLQKDVPANMWLPNNIDTLSLPLTYSLILFYLCLAVPIFSANKYWCKGFVLLVAKWCGFQTQYAFDKNWAIRTVGRSISSDIIHYIFTPCIIYRELFSSFEGRIWKVIDCGET